MQKRVDSGIKPNRNWVRNTYMHTLYKKVDKQEGRRGKAWGKIWVCIYTGILGKINGFGIKNTNPSPKLSLSKLLSQTSDSASVKRAGWLLDLQRPFCILPFQKGQQFLFLLEGGSIIYRDTILFFFHFPLLELPLDGRRRPQWCFAGQLLPVSKPPPAGIWLITGL